MPTKKRYISKRDCLNTGDRQFGLNEPCEFTDDDARSLLALGAIEPADEASHGASTPASKAVEGTGAGQGTSANDAKAVKAPTKAPTKGATKRTAKKPAKG